MSITAAKTAAFKLTMMNHTKTSLHNLIRSNITRAAAPHFVNSYPKLHPKPKEGNDNHRVTVMELTRFVPYSFGQVGIKVAAEHDDADTGSDDEYVEDCDSMSETPRGEESEETEFSEDDAEGRP